MEAALEGAEVLVPPSSALDTEGAEAEALPLPQDPKDKFSRRLEDIIGTYGSAKNSLQKQSAGKAEVEKMKEEAGDDIPASMEKEVGKIMQSLKKVASPEKKVENLAKKYAEMATLRRSDEKKMCVLQQKFSGLQKEKELLQEEQRSGLEARSELESLCKELYSHYKTLKEEMLQRCREDDEKRTEISGHFQSSLTDIQAQIEQHSARNAKLCQENSNLNNKLEGLMNQYELREESLEKINKHRDLQHKLTEAKLEQANALLAEAQEKHIREKEYLLVQAAEWKLQAQQLREQGTVMQAQLTLYSQKFDEFQETLSKSNAIYVHFKQEMEKMSEKMKSLEKESDLWKSRFENCNKALTEMIDERAEKGKEFELFVFKIQKLEKLCRTLQDERAILYEKIKEVRCIKSGISPEAVVLPQEDSPLLTEEELQELQEGDPRLTLDMARLKQEQAKLQDFAASLLSTSMVNDDKDDKDNLKQEEDLVAAAFDHYQTKAKAEKKPEQTEENQAVSVQEESPKPVSEPVKEEEDHKAAELTAATLEAPTAEEKTEAPCEETPAERKAEVVEEKKTIQPLPKQSEEILKQPESEHVSTPEPEKVKTDQPTEGAEGNIVLEVSEVKPVVPAEAEKAQQQQEQQSPETLQTPEAPPTKSESAPPAENNTASPKAKPTSNADASKKQAPKKKKKRGGKNAS
ncbi:beta-taxilin [Genypterus blacodes]|uniref:beta-taxilin n=1 Tax=Genypterus blacodes TaxID=154954 RepID=UPI003F759B68